MDGMIWIHANAAQEERRVLQVMDADMQADTGIKSAMIDNTWSVTIPEKVWEEDPVAMGHFIYCPDTEWGGPVTVINHNTGAGQITLQGPTWRGQLYRRYIQPPAGEGYLVFTDTDANEVIRQVLGQSFGPMYAVVSEAAGVNISASFRYQTYAGGLQNALRGYGLRLDVKYDNAAGKVYLSAQPTNSLADAVEISQDYGVNFSSSMGNVEFANHCLALGKGELAERMVANVYRTKRGYSTTKPASLPEKDIRSVKLEYPNAESLEELIKSAIETLEEYAQAQAVNVDTLSIGLNAHLGDTLYVRDRVTGLMSKAEIISQILTISEGVTKIDIKVDTATTELEE